MYLDCPPTGLVAITNLDSASAVLDDSYFAIVNEFMARDEKALKELYRKLPITISDSLKSHEQLTKLVWL